jgi:hypothetical protein
MKKFNISKDLGKYIKTNAPCFRLKIKGQTLYILPDKTIAVTNKNNIHVIDTNGISISYKDDYVIWHDSLPKDAEVARWTWQNVNNDGSRDRRFSENKQVPVCKFGTITLQSEEGLHIVLYGSDWKRVKSAINDFSCENKI